MDERVLAERPVGSDGGAGRRGASSERTGGRAARSVTVNLAESPISWLAARGMIDVRQEDAGEMLRADYERAGLGPRVTMRWEPASRGRGGAGRDRLEPTVAALSAKQRFDGALAAAGPGLADVLWRVVCAGEGLAAAEKALGWPARAGKLVLGLALDRVAGFYRL